ncbi:MAG: phage tail protein [Allosphingosinicella sp.]|uniref:phage tail protein n=1 Tax=Allosphingosinicella sp. TaxID=2823234 RepID=UPI0039474FDA
MATLVLTAVGSAIGGPLGGAIGGMIGQAADAAIFAPKTRESARMATLAVQTSSYGNAIPKIFGRMRVAGTVIWATDLVERRTTSGGGKGRPKTASYSYSANFAVALSGRPILGVGRIWAEGKLLRGAAGDFKSETGFRLYHGDEAQLPDPLIAAVEGAGGAPAYRGIAYAVFEDFQLEDYGNRIPSLTFEVEADPGPVTVGAVAEELSGGAVASGGGPALIGYAAGGESVRGAIEQLAAAASLSFVETDGGLRLGEAGGAEATLGERVGAVEIVRGAADAVPGEVAISYHDPARDYQAGLQRASLGGPSVRSERIAFPAVLHAAEAKGLAERRLAALSAARARAKLDVPWREEPPRPGARVRIAGQAGLWKVERWTLGRLICTLELARVSEGLGPNPAGADAGRPIGHRDAEHGPTMLRLYDLPLPFESERPVLAAMAAGPGAGWRRAALSASFDGGLSWTSLGASAGPATIGVAATGLGAAGSALFDDRHAVEVALLNEDMWLESRSDAALVAGANLALLGDELIQFGRAEPLGDGRFLLSRLLRGRRGTEWAAHDHQAGEDFALIDARDIVLVEAPAESLGAEAWVRAAGRGDPAPVSAVRRIGGAALMPPAPVHLTAVKRDGDIRLDWVRRSRQGYGWASGSGTPLGEESERYEVTIAGPGFERRASVGAASYIYSAAQRLEDGGGGPLWIEVRQAGTHGLSRAARAVWPG